MYLGLVCVLGVCVCVWGFSWSFSLCLCVKCVFLLLMKIPPCSPNSYGFYISIQGLIMNLIKWFWWLGLIGISHFPYLHWGMIQEGSGIAWRTRKTWRKAGEHTTAAPVAVCQLSFFVFFLCGPPCLFCSLFDTCPVLDHSRPFVANPCH